MSTLVATRPSANSAESSTNTTTADIERFIARQNGFIAGTSIEYDPSFICTGFENQHLATGFRIGQRFHSAKAVRLADGCPVPLGHLVKADGRWRIFVFGNEQDPTRPSSNVYQSLKFLEHTASSPLRRYTPEGNDIDSVIDTYAVFQQENLSLEDLGSLLWPAKGKYGLRDYEKVFFPQQVEDIYEQRGIDRDSGCMIIVRPDQHVANVLPLTAYHELSVFFDSFMLA